MMKKMFITGIFYLLVVWRTTLANEFYAYYTRLDVEDAISGKTSWGLSSFV